MNDLARAANRLGWPRSDWDQFLQLIGYSVSGAPFLDPRTHEEGSARAERLFAKYPMDPEVLLPSPSKEGG